MGFFNSECTNNEGQTPLLEEEGLKTRLDSVKRRALVLKDYQMF
jgi:hypothetical protein